MRRLGRRGTRRPSRLQGATVALALAAVCGPAACAPTPETVAENVAEGGEGERAPEAGGAGGPAGWTTYADERLGFRIDHPSDFVVKAQDAARLADFDPAPVASIFFMNPRMAAGDLAGLEPPDLELRVYAAGGAESLEAWLEEARFAPGDGAAGRPYRRGGVTGLEVCRSDLIAPGCSFFVLAADHVYQLTPASLDGEAMIETFQPPP